MVNQQRSEGNRIWDPVASGLPTRLAIYLLWRWGGTYVCRSRHMRLTHMRINTAPGWALGTHEDQHSPQAKADQGISSSGMGSDLAWTAPILTQPLNQNQPLISSLISSYNSDSR